MPFKPSGQIYKFGNPLDLSSIEPFDSEQLAKYLKEQEELITLFEKASTLAKRSRKYNTYNPGETWASRWVAAPIGYLLPEARREEWLGDLYEVNQEMIKKGFPLLIVNLINIVRTFILTISALNIQLKDLLKFGIGNRQRD